MIPKCKALRHKRRKIRKTWFPERGVTHDCKPNSGALYIGRREEIFAAYLLQNRAPSLWAIMSAATLAQIDAESAFQINFRGVANRRLIGMDCVCDSRDIKTNFSTQVTPHQ